MSGAVTPPPTLPGGVMRRHGAVESTRAGIPGHARAALKAAGRMAARMCVLAALARYRIATMLLGRQRAFAGVVQHAARWTGMWGAYRRRELLRMLGVAAEDCYVEFGTLLSKPTARIGPGAYVGAYCCLGDARIGPKAMLADGVCVPSGAHQHGTGGDAVPMADQAGRPETIHIGADCWIGARAVVLADVDRGAIVAAGAVVTRPVPAGDVVAGVPAKRIGRRATSHSPDQRTEAPNR